MTASKTKSVNMNFPALYSYVINTNYRNAMGVFSIILSIASLIILVVFWDKLATGHRILFGSIGLIFTVINPISLAFKAYKQFKLSPSYKKPLVYTFGDTGITVAQGDISQEITWDMIYRVMLTSKMIAIYTGRMHAFVIPLSELGEEKSKIITAVVQFTADYKPILSKNLKEYQSGKGI